MENNLKKFIEECKTKGVNDVDNIIRIALAEQHRNTRHDIIDMLVEFTYAAPVTPISSVMNMKQRSPLD